MPNWRSTCNNTLTLLPQCASLVESTSLEVSKLVLYHPFECHFSYRPIISFRLVQSLLLCFLSFPMRSIPSLIEIDPKKTCDCQKSFCLKAFLGNVPEFVSMEISKFSRATQTWRKNRLSTC